MTVKAYVGKDSVGRKYLPEWPREHRAVVEIIELLWKHYHSSLEPCAVIANLTNEIGFPQADMVIITENGIGIVELKDNPGRVEIRGDGKWYAGGKLLESRRGINPRIQVQNYANMIRSQILDYIQHPNFTLNSDDIWFQTTVCFSHQKHLNPNFLDEVSRRYRPRSNDENIEGAEPWENFSAQTIGTMLKWIMTLGFGGSISRPQSIPYRMTPTEIENIAKLFLGVEEWTEVYDVMPEVAPYGCVQLIEGDRTITYPLSKDSFIIGRSDKCDITLVPQSDSKYRYKAVHRGPHARIFRSLAGVFIEDMGSDSGTFVNYKKITQPTKITPSHYMTLGGGSPNYQVPLFRLVLIPRPEGDSTIHRESIAK